MLTQVPPPPSKASRAFLPFFARSNLDLFFPFFAFFNCQSQGAPLWSDAL